jgi:hypothetical protein
MPWNDSIICSVMCLSEGEADLSTCFQTAWQSSGKAATAKRAKQAAKKTGEQALEQLQGGSGFASEVPTHTGT